MSGSASSEAQHTFDATKPGKYTIRFGESLADPTTSQKRFSSILFNHKPSQTGRTRNSTITPSNRANLPLELSIEDEDEDTADSIQCTYSGRKRDLVDSYIFAFDPEKQGFELDALSCTYEFNMVSATWEKDEAKLVQQYKQINTTERHTSPPVDGYSPGTDSDAGTDSEPDPNNPYDYRHYLNGIPGVADSKQPSTVSTPIIGARVVHASPSPLARRQNDSTRQAIRGRSSPSDPSDPSRLQVPNRTSKIRVHAPDSGDDAGELVIDEGPPPPAKKRRTAPPKGQRPMSLQRAAQAAQSSRHASPPPQEAGSGYEEDDESDGNKGTNDDVEELELPEPAAEGPRPQMRRQSTWDEGDQEALQRALEEAFQEREDDDDDDGDADGVEGEKRRGNGGEGANEHALESESESEEE